MLGGTAAAVDAEGAVAAGVAAVAPDNLGAERFFPKPASNGAAVGAERMTGVDFSGEGFALVIEFRSFSCGIVFHIVFVLLYV